MDRPSNFPGTPRPPASPNMAPDVPFTPPGNFGGDTAPSPDPGPQFTRPEKPGGFAVKAAMAEGPQGNADVPPRPRGPESSPPPADESTIDPRGQEGGKSEALRRTVAEVTEDLAARYRGDADSRDSDTTRIIEKYTEEAMEEPVAGHEDQSAEDAASRDETAEQLLLASDTPFMFGGGFFAVRAAMAKQPEHRDSEFTRPPAPGKGLNADTSQAEPAHYRPETEEPARQPESTTDEATPDEDGSPAEKAAAVLGAGIADPPEAQAPEPSGSGSPLQNTPNVIPLGISEPDDPALAERMGDTRGEQAAVGDQGHGEGLVGPRDELRAIQRRDLDQSMIEWRHANLLFPYPRPEDQDQGER